MTHDYEPDEHLEMDYEDRVSGNVDDDVRELDFDLDAPLADAFDDEEDEDDYEVPDLPPPGLADYDDFPDSLELED